MCGDDLDGCSEAWSVLAILQPLRRGLVFLAGAAHDDLECIVGEGALQRLRRASAFRRVDRPAVASRTVAVEDVAAVAE
jgi:hypothetical protein